MVMMLDYRWWKGRATMMTKLYYIGRSLDGTIIIMLEVSNGYINHRMLIIHIYKFSIDFVI